MKSTYIIGEIGQNHNGSVDIAKLIVDLVSRPVREEVFNLELRPMDAVKMTKRDLSEELTDSQMNRPYDSPHSFGRTYGEHRAYLELTDEEHFDVYKHAKSLGLDFVETLCSKGCMSLLKLFTPDRLSRTIPGKAEIVYLLDYGCSFLVNDEIFVLVHEVAIHRLACDRLATHAF